MAPLPAPSRLLQTGLVGLTTIVSLALGRSDYDATTSGETDVPEWLTSNTLQLNLSVTPGEFAVIPLTEHLGLNGSESSRGLVKIEGNIIRTDDSNYNEITSPEDVAYLSCDEPEGDTNIGPDRMLDSLMQAAPRAIVLYSTTENWCSLSHEDSLAYTSILSLVDAAEASAVLDYLNGTNSGTQVQVSITGDAARTDSSSNKRGGSSTAAMGVLYSITGLISLLFIVIITTGAVRAHRYPERYGPRGAFGGRPRQSRAKGLARAVLDTLPIVKFGNQQPSKPDPELEMETATADGQEIAPQRTASVGSGDRHPEATASAGAGSKATSAPTYGSPAANAAGKTTDGHLGCSICTEDFKVGEDVRVLPCSHQFHPSCVDPWLINVSGTCPLCRLNLQPGHESGNSESAADGNGILPPPLALEGDETTANNHRNRVSRIFDINRLRQATAEEQMEALRQMRRQGAEPGAAEPDRDERHQGARFADKLKEKFRIRTRAQSPERRDC